MCAGIKKKKKEDLLVRIENNGCWETTHVPATSLHPPMVGRNYFPVATDSELSQV